VFPGQFRFQSLKIVLEEICKTFDIRLIGKAGKKNHGRVAYVLSIGHGDCFLDLSFLGAKDVENNSTR
jgi:hypothetical protein